MAITKTVTITALRYHEATTVPVEEPATLWVDYKIVIDDPNDNDLPITTIKSERLYANSDFSNEESIIRNLANVVFSQ